ncbi:50S ribosomal protein L22 [Candidatus Berkelbacteria bacterium CG10_big_fil_rev_8_21_14_0_10_41_12]|uniref:50S ribosomal protein L22 n=1 Tax=Candidatus Berkelbacteria bacterium CG10_big_fil_rev_8_21_14_0_10_41_12 TaxID=1974513 RepID=A0A2M6WXZ0_9BACT|nr:MAG: 50S ribosomal protein L22 [Candidatus Berkelbacteria bacterium CG10_big_fil_rev_8_21_14_0_10_41_12]
MEIKVSSRYQKVSPKKARLVADLIRGMKIQDAEDQLENLNKKSASQYLALIKQIKAILKDKGISDDNIVVQNVVCKEGPRLKRRIFAGRGHANRILKRMSHLSMVAGENVVKKTHEKKINKKIGKNGPKV